MGTEGGEIIMSLSKKHYKKIAELIGKHTVKPNLKTETNVNFIAYGFVWDLAKYFIEDSKKKPEGFRFKPETFYDAINKESINADFDAINKSMIKINLDTIKENKILKSKVKTYEADINKKYNIPIVKTDEAVNEIMDDMLSIENPKAIK